MVVNDCILLVYIYFVFRELVSGIDHNTACSKILPNQTVV